MQFCASFKLQFNSAFRDTHTHCFFSAHNVASDKHKGICDISSERHNSFFTYFASRALSNHWVLPLQKHTAAIQCITQLNIVNSPALVQWYFLIKLVYIHFALILQTKQLLAIRTVDNRLSS